MNKIKIIKCVLFLAFLKLLLVIRSDFVCVYVLYVVVVILPRTFFVDLFLFVSVIIRSKQKKRKKRITEDTFNVGCETDYHQHLFSMISLSLISTSKQTLRRTKNAKRNKISLCFFIFSGHLIFLYFLFLETIKKKNDPKEFFYLNE